MKIQVSGRFSSLFLSNSAFCFGILALSLFFSGCEAAPQIDGPGPKSDGMGGDRNAGSGGRTDNIDLGTGGDTTSGSGGTGTTVSTCGNGELEAGEWCDDGNTKDGDGCSKDCLTQDPNFDCSKPGKACTNLVVCGNGIIEGDEACDDGNTKAGDGCSKNCGDVEAGFSCPRPNFACVALGVCGNGVRERGEQCDDGQDPPTDGDGCSATCQFENEAGYQCIVPGEPCVPRVCGNGVRTNDEACDDGQMPPQNGDGCSDTCTVEPGFRCNQDGCTAICGDGIFISGKEECDDGARVSADGCSAACTVEPFFSCTGSPSSCVSTISCNNGILEPGEICDAVGVGGCLPGCKAFSPDPSAASVCGNHIIEAGETCDAPGLGCSATCQQESGFSCSRPDTCFALPECGDGILHSPLGEACDDGNKVDGDGCSGCGIDMGYVCFGLQPSVCKQDICGDGVRTENEDCDDKNMVSGDGCTNCQIDDGYICPVVGKACVEKCGDGQVLGNEECDDGNRINDDGCNSGCRIEPGFACPPEGGDCVGSVCGDGNIDTSEGCDDGNDVAGDGCSATCQKEPTITVGPSPTVSLACGDGLITAGEACDDGNTISGDGCAADCLSVEADYTCTDYVKLPETLKIQVTYRDFKRRADSGGHPDFEWQPNPSRLGMPGPVCKTTNTTACTALAGSACPTNTCGRLDSEGKPEHHLTGDDSARGRVTSAASYALWYRDTNASNLAGENGTIEMWNVKDYLTLTQSAPGSTAYVFDSNSHFPLTGKGFGNTPGQTKNFHFTSELRYFFQYNGGETLTFRGDDDVWVFVNGRHAVDIGGVHGALWGRVLLGDDGDGGATDSNCSVHSSGSTPATCNLESGELAAIADDKRFGLVKGGVYEIVLFHAERHTTASNFRLTLDGFLAPRSFCSPTCGDGKLLPGEVCDDGTDENTNTDDNDPANDETGVCNDNCTRRAFCGDGEVNIGEECDNGTNLDVYLFSSDPDACAPGCVLPSECGDSTVQPAFESCDNGPANNDLSYGATSCKTDCQLGGYCGDGTLNGGEFCDEGALNGKEYGPGTCGYDCLAGPYCGDGIRNGGEECDGTEGCDALCKQGPFCGDGLIGTDETCDWGQFASTAYGGCTSACEQGPYCGDGNKDAGFEECDAGSLNNDTTYDGCTTTCAKGPRCGDAMVQSADGETCDNGYNDDPYKTSAEACGTGCKEPPNCGDGEVQLAFEDCDNGASNNDSTYNGCSTSCQWGPYCGDGDLQPEDEECDDGANNTAYSATGSACGYDCKPAPYCGDGVRNGPEQCDNGETNNVGGYGKCKSDCTRDAFCGDKIVQKDQGEQCDDGPTGSLNCSVTCTKRTIIR